MSAPMSDRPALPTRAPRPNAETDEFWAGCTEGRFLLPRCDDCGEHIWYPRRFCPFCASTSVTYAEVSGLGSVYTFTIVRKGAGPFRDSGPYVIAFVELDEGPRIMTNLVGVDVDQVSIGQRVHVVFEPVLDETGAVTARIPRFTSTD
jgi:uncharacterized protein